MAHKGGRTDSNKKVRSRTKCRTGIGQFCRTNSQTYLIVAKYRVWIEHSQTDLIVAKDSIWTAHVCRTNSHTRVIVIIRCSTISKQLLSHIFRSRTSCKQTAIFRS